MSTFDQVFEGGRVMATALFNKLNGAHVTEVSIPLDQLPFDKDLYVGRSILFNFAEDVLVGKLIVKGDGVYDDAFTIMKRSEQKEQVYEKTLNMMAEQKITKAYPLVDQVNLLVKAIQRLGKEHDLLEHQEFVDLSEMVSYIDQCIATNKAKKEFYSESPDVEYISDEEADARLATRMEGGIHEDIGPRAIVGGSVFGTQRR